MNRQSDIQSSEQIQLKPKKQYSSIKKANRSKIMKETKQRVKRTGALEKLSVSAHVILESKQKTRFDTIHKTISHKTIVHDASMTNRNKFRHIRSQTSMVYNIARQNPYDNFVNQMAIVLPSPTEKFIQFMQISPFNRSHHHLQLIQHFIKQYKFFKNHPVELLSQMAKKIKIENKQNIDHKMIAIVESGECYYNKERFLRGDIVGRKELKPQDIICECDTRFFVLNRHQYQFLIASHLDKEKEKFRNFLANVYIFKMFPKKAFDRFVENMTLTYLTPGEHLYRFGDEVTKLFVVFKGKASRKVIVEIDKINKIPLLKYQKVVKILSKSYEHKIQFAAEDLIGIAEVIDHIETRKQNIRIEQNSIILGLDKNVFEQSLDEYIVDRLRKQNMKKYPITYDKLCEKFQKEKVLLRKQEMRKIQALRGTITQGISQIKSQKINSIIRKYQQNIKKSQLRNLLECKIQERSVHRQ